MFQLDDKFLQSVGLGDLPADQKQAFLQHTYETLEERVGTRLAESLSEAQLEEFEGFATHNEEKINAWLAEHVPNYAEEEDYKRLAASAPENVPPLVVAAEFASVRWLGINSPNYRDVVAEELNKLRDEIVASKDNIAAAAGDDQPTPQE
ncbi:hypothetical protein A3F64_00710 [Candidatus Saccharibacteria bacterium RIFCSPHIGHO2_12_FULL_42_8]|nr:MAG: hypothetical protein A3F64_00710 [Candidatus Saccharibacteria bacterium RIFCSPHIGHO2_12_FULL_42_8]